MRHFLTYFTIWFLGAVSSVLVLGMFLSGETIVEGSSFGDGETDLDMIRRINGEMAGLVDTNSFSVYVIPEYSGYTIRARSHALAGRFRMPDWDRILRPVRTRIDEILSEQQQAEQDGTRQPATRYQSKSEGSDKPQPEAEGRSR